MAAAQSVCFGQSCNQSIHCHNSFVLIAFSFRSVEAGNLPAVAVGEVHIDVHGLGDECLLCSILDRNFGPAIGLQCDIHVNIPVSGVISRHIAAGGVIDIELHGIAGKPAAIGTNPGTAGNAPDSSEGVVISVLDNGSVDNQIGGSGIDNDLVFPCLPLGHLGYAIQKLLGIGDFCLLVLGKCVVCCLCIQNGLLVAAAQSVCFGQGVDHCNDAFVAGILAQLFHCCHASIQLCLMLCGNQSLGSLGQCVIGSLCCVNRCLIFQSQVLCILQCLDHCLHLCNLRAVNQLIRQGVDRGDLPLTNYLGGSGENTEDIPLDLNVVGQLDEIPARLQGSGV